MLIQKKIQKNLKGKEIGNVYIVCFLLQLFLQQKYGIKATTYETIFLKEIVYIQCQFALHLFFFLSKILIFIYTGTYWTYIWTSKL